MTRVWNFSAGPAALPEAVLRQAADEMLDCQGAGVSVMEMSHRSPEFTEIFQGARQRLASLLNVPETHEVLFMQGGAVAQNALVPMNLCRGYEQAAFVNTGTWSLKTLREFSKYGQAKTVLASDQPSADGYAPMGYVPDCSSLVTQVKGQNMAYLHYCDNETVVGVQFNGQIEALVNDLDCPVVVDASSNILSRLIDFSKVDLVYAGAQKNIGPAGLTIVIVNKSLFGRALPICPTAFHYETVAASDSMYNTPPSYAVYIAGLVFKWLEDQGGVSWAAQQAKAKSKLLYSLIDASEFYRSPVRSQDRSVMNVPFVLADDALNARFLSGAKQAGLVQLKGHKLVGGMRASLYNAMPLEGVQALVDFMRAFEKEVA